MVNTVKELLCFALVKGRKHGKHIEPSDTALQGRIRTSKCAELLQLCDAHCLYSAAGPTAPAKQTTYDHNIAQVISRCLRFSPPDSYRENP